MRPVDLDDVHGVQLGIVQLGQLTAEVYHCAVGGATDSPSIARRQGVLVDRSCIGRKVTPLGRRQAP